MRVTNHINGDPTKRTMGLDDPELKFLQSLIPDMERAVIDAACEHRGFEAACVQEKPHDPVWAHAYKARVVLTRTIDNLLGTRAEIEELTRQPTK